MERDQGGSANLMDREERIVADLLNRFTNLVVLATESVGSAPSVGGAAYNSLAMEIQTRGMVKSAEDLLSLTRLLRELWVVGPLMRPGEGEQETQQVIDDNVQGVVDMLNRLRQTAREDMVKGLGLHGAYQVKAVEGHSLGATQMASQGATQGASQAVTTQASQANGSA